MILKLSLIASVLFLVCCLSGASSGQVKPDPVISGGFVLHVDYMEGRPTDLSPVYSGRGAWYALFKRTASLPKSSSLPVRAVNIVPIVDGENVSLNISVYVGRKTHEDELFVARYTIREHEKIRINELADFGVEPFQIGLSRRGPTVGQLPRVENKTESLQVILEPVTHTVPSFKVTYFNLSNRPIYALNWTLTRNGRSALTSSPQGTRGHPLILPNQYFKAQITVESPESSPPPRAGNSSDDLVLVISTIVFDDGSFEGDPQPAAKYAVAKLARKVQTQRIAAMLEEVAGTQSDKAGLNRLADAVIKVIPVIDDASFKEVVGRFPMLTNAEIEKLKIAAEVAMRSIALDLKKELAAFYNSPSAQMGNEITRKWLESKAAEYRDWNQRLSN